MKLYYTLLLILVTIIFLSGCVQKTPSESITDACTKACKDAITAGQKLEAGPCLLDPMPENPDWVCDVAHNPRQSVDNISKNQCQAFRDGKAHYFIEVDPDCKIIPR